jgi:uncharacterized protein DUF6941
MNNMMSAIAIFCSDVRQEKGGTETIVGVFPDSVNLPKIPGAFAQMYVYVRMHMRPSFRPSSIVTKLVLPDGTELDQSPMEPDLIERTREKAIASNSPYMGLIAKFAMVPMHITQEGRLQAIVSVDGEDHVVGALNCRLAPSTTT